MTEELPDWVREFEDKEPSEEKATTKKPTKKSSKKSSFSKGQIAVLTVMAVLLCGVGAIVLWLLATSFNSQTSDSIAEQPPAVAEALGATDVATPTLTPTPTLSSPPTPTPEPSATATFVVPPDVTNRDTIADITEFTERWRDLVLPAPVPINFLTRDQLRGDWQTESVDADTLEVLQTQQEFYLALGLIEPDVDLVQAAFDSQSDILLGYYTPEEKAMYIIAESVNMFAQERITFAHEYVHALQDHHFDLQRLLSIDASSDALLAARSLPEGDASVLEAFFTDQHINQSQIDYNIYRYLLADHPVLEGVSSALGILTYFPYTAGEYFVTYLFIEGGYSWDRVNQAYNNVPVSSEQVMHPEKYLAGEQPIPVSLPDVTLALGGNWRQIDDDVLGEIGLLVWLIDQTTSEEASEGAAGWGGDRYGLWVDDDNRRVLVESSVWDSEAEASQFVAAFTTYMNLRESATPGVDEANGRFWNYEVGVTMIRQRGRDVLIVVAPERSVLDQVLGLF